MAAVAQKLGPHGSPHPLHRSMCGMEKQDGDLSSCDCGLVIPEHTKQGVPCFSWC